MTRQRSELLERHYMRCPYHLAKSYLAASLAERAESGAPSTLTLKAPLLGAEVKKNVVVTFSTGADPMHFDQPWRVRWTPEGGGAYPDFEGELTVRADEDYSTSILELRGEYAPPGGALGEAFDHVVGSKIASSTARALLDEIAAGMVAHYERDEAAKHADSAS